MLLADCRDRPQVPPEEGLRVPRLPPETAAAIAALDSDPDYRAFKALQRGDRDGRLEALTLWTSWPRNSVAPLLNRDPRLSIVTEALIAGLQSHTSCRLGRGERATYDLLVELYAEGGRLPVENADEHGLLRVCDRCDLVTRGPRNAARCPDCGHRHSSRVDNEPPRFTPCPMCGVRPVTDARKRCEDCETERNRAKKAAQARRRRARHRSSPPPQ
jgi:hypothetical protein